MKRVCLITGGSGRLGTALAEKLGASWDLVLGFREHLPVVPTQMRAGIEAAASWARPDDFEAYAVKGDLQAEQEQRRLVELALARFGRVDVLVNAAADTKFHGHLLDLAYSEGAELRQLELNCVQPLRMASLIFHECWKDNSEANLRANRCVVNISSISGLQVYPGVGQAFYAASKAALNHLTRFLADELRPYRVRANAICPARFANQTSTENVAKAVLELVEGAASGQVVEVRKS